MEKKTYAFDIDGVICETKGSKYDQSLPNKEAIEKINNLHKKGHYIIIFTARFMGRTNNDYKKATDLYNSIMNSDLTSSSIKERVNNIHEFYIYK